MYRARPSCACASLLSQHVLHSRATRRDHASCDINTNLSRGIDYFEALDDDPCGLVGPRSLADAAAPRPSPPPVALWPTRLHRAQPRRELCYNEAHAVQASRNRRSPHPPSGRKARSRASTRYPSVICKPCRFASKLALIAPRLPVLCDARRGFVRCRRRAGLGTGQCGPRTTQRRGPRASAFRRATVTRTRRRLISRVRHACEAQASKSAREQCAICAPSARSRRGLAWGSRDLDRRSSRRSDRLRWTFRVRVLAGPAILRLRRCGHVRGRRRAGRRAQDTTRVRSLGFSHHPQASRRRRVSPRVLRAGQASARHTACARREGQAAGD